MDSRGSDAQKDVTSCHLRAVDETALLDHTGCETGDVIFTVSIHARHLGGFAAHKGATGLAAAFGHTGDYRLDHLGTGLSLGYIIQEEERLGSLRQDVVHAHGHRVDANGVVLVHGECYLQFRPDSVGSAYKHRFLVAQRSEVEHTPEGADAAHYSGAVGGSDVLLDAAYHFVAGFEVDT